MTTFQRLMALYWCLVPVELAYTWLDVTRQRAPWGTWRRTAAARRQLWVAPGAAAAYLVGFAAALALVVRLTRLEVADQAIGVACSALLVLSAWNDSRRTLDAWRERGITG